MEEQYPVAYKFTRSPDDCVGNQFCLCVKCRDRFEVIEKANPALPRPSGGDVDDQPRPDNPEPRRFVTHTKNGLQSDKGAVLWCWKDKNGDIDFGKGVWRA